MLDSFFKLLGIFVFGNCVGCFNGFVLIDNDSFIVLEVFDVNIMEMWLQVLGQFVFVLFGNLQMLSGVGWISGIVFFCVIGLQVQYSVYSDFNNVFIEFFIYIYCLELVSDCCFNFVGIFDCNVNVIYFFVGVLVGCFVGDVIMEWIDVVGNVVGNGFIINYFFEGNQGWYYFIVVDDCCMVCDFFLVIDFEFVDVGFDESFCNGIGFFFVGIGGQGYFWMFLDGIFIIDFVY